MSPPVENRTIAEIIDLPKLEKSLRSVRSLHSAVMSVIIGALSVLAMVPLASVLWMLLQEGITRVDWSLFTKLPPAAGMDGGGIGNAFLGTLLVVALATLISVPIGILAAVFLAEFGPDTKTAEAVRFCARSSPDCRRSWPASLPTVSWCSPPGRFRLRPPAWPWPC